jgi:hypothetical protein
MAKFVLGRVVRTNSVTHVFNPVEMNIPCDGAKPEYMAWLVPLKDPKGVLYEYMSDINQYGAIGSGTKPTNAPDAIRCYVVLTEKGDTLYILAPDTATMATFTAKCNQCCGVVPVLDAVTIPTLISEDRACPVDGVSSFVFPLAYNPNALTYNLSGSFNGQPATPSPAGQTFSDAASILAWVQANWGYTGTFTWSLNSGNTVLQLSAPAADLHSAGIEIGLNAAKYCFSYPASATMTADAVSIGGNIIPFTNGAVTFSSTNNGPLVYALAHFLIGQLSVTTGEPAKLSYIGQQVPGALYYQGTLVSGGAFTGGACNWTFTFAVPALTGGQTYHVTQPNFNGVPAAALTGQPFASGAAMLAAIQTQWGTNITWTMPDSSHLQGVSSTISAIDNLVITAS